MQNAELKTEPSFNVVSLQAGAESERSAFRAPRSALEPLLLFEHVSKWYGPVLALNQVTLELTGGITGLVGANGAGKSTLIRLATGQTRPTIGRVTVAGVDAWDWRARLLVGYCPDHDDFPLSVRVEVDRPRDLARRLLEVPDVIGCDVDGDAVVVRAKHPQRFFAAFGRLVVAELIDVRRLEPLDDSAHAILGYLLGGSGKT